MFGPLQPFPRHCVLTDFEEKGSQALLKECFVGILHDGPTDVSCRLLFFHLRSLPVSPRNDEHHFGHFSGRPNWRKGLMNLTHCFERETRASVIHIRSTMPISKLCKFHTARTIVGSLSVRPQSEKRLSCIVNLYLRECSRLAFHKSHYFYSKLMR